MELSKVTWENITSALKKHRKVELALNPFRYLTLEHRDSLESRYFYTLEHKDNPERIAYQEEGIRHKAGILLVEYLEQNKDRMLIPHFSQTKSRARGSFFPEDRESRIRIDIYELLL